MDKKTIAICLLFVFCEIAFAWFGGTTSETILTNKIDTLGTATDTFYSNKFAIDVFSGFQLLIDAADSATGTDSLFFYIYAQFGYDTLTWFTGKLLDSMVIEGKISIPLTIAPAIYCRFMHIKKANGNGKIIVIRKEIIMKSDRF